MLKEVAENLWHLEHTAHLFGVGISTRMTIVRLPDGRLFLHTPVPMSDLVRKQLSQLGVVSFIVAPSKKHYRYLAESHAMYPEAVVYGAPGLREKHPELEFVEEIPTDRNLAWWPHLEFFLFNGIPSMNETVWFHRASRTLILSDLCQWWQGEISWPEKCFASMMGVRKQLAVPAIVQILTFDHPAARLSAQRILQWPFTRAIIAHNLILEKDAHLQLANALRCMIRN